MTASRVILGCFVAFAAPVLGAVVSIASFLPPTDWDNIGMGLTSQNFVTEDTNFYGVRLNIGSPGGQPLPGPADLVLLDATDLVAPAELGRFRFADVGAEFIENHDILLTNPVASPCHRLYGA